MEKRYQVFVSSTFKDLQEERQEVMQALLELDCMPAGMELFPAANEDQWTLIKKVIDDSDYYIVIIGGRYGSIGPGGHSYTEMEYRYALENNKPIIAFLHKNPGELPANRTEESTDGKEKLTAFRDFAQGKMVKYWTTPADLGSMVSRSLVVLIKTTPAIGWVKANSISDEANAENLKLRKLIETLEKQLAEAKTNPPEITKQLSHGGDEIEINYSFSSMKKASETTYTASFTSTWDELFSILSPNLINESTELSMMKILNTYIYYQNYKRLLDDQDLKGTTLSNFEIEPEDFNTIKIQFIALGLIKKSDKNRSVKDLRTYWTLTPYGETRMIELRAIKK